MFYMRKSIVLIENLCERRLLEYDRLRRYLDANHIQVHTSGCEAELVLFFACGMKEDDTQLKVSQALRCGKAVALIGCAPSMLRIEKNERLLKVPLQKLSMLDKLLNVMIPFDRITLSSYSSLSRSNIIRYSDAIRTWDPRLVTPSCKDVFSVKISDGCSRHCSYCAICRATGNLSSIAPLKK